MRVLFLAPQPFFQPRGTPLAERALLAALALRGYQVDVLTYHLGEDIELPNCTIYRIPAPPLIRQLRPGFSGKKLVCDLVLLAEALGRVRRQRYDLVHAVEEAAFIAALLRRLYGLPFVYDMDSSLAQQMIERFGWLRPAQRALEGAERFVVRRSVGVIAVCGALEELARHHDPEKLVARLEDTSLVGAEGGGEERLAETIGKPGPFVLYVGNLERYQGIDLLLAGFAQAAPGAPAAQLVVIGGSAPEIRPYREQAARLGIGDRVHFLGPRPVAQLGSFLRQAEVLVSPRSQGFNTPMKIYSYLDSGTATLATRLPTHTQVLDDEIACLAEPEPAALAEGLLRLLADPALRRGLAQRARARVRQEFSAEAFARKVDTFYDDVERKLATTTGRGRSTAETLPSQL